MNRTRFGSSVSGSWSARRCRVDDGRIQCFEQPPVFDGNVGVARKRLEELRVVGVERVAVETITNRDPPAADLATDRRGIASLQPRRASQSTMTGSASRGPRTTPEAVRVVSTIAASRGSTVPCAKRSSRPIEIIRVSSSGARAARFPRRTSRACTTTASRPHRLHLPRNPERELVQLLYALVADIRSRTHGTLGT